MPGRISGVTDAVPVLTPNFLASMLAAMQEVVSASTGTTAMGLPRRWGWWCCSTGEVAVHVDEETAERVRAGGLVLGHLAGASSSGYRTRSVRSEVMGLRKSL